MRNNTKRGSDGNNHNDQYNAEKAMSVGGGGDHGINDSCKVIRRILDSSSFVVGRMIISEPSKWNLRAKKRERDNFFLAAYQCQVKEIGVAMFFRHLATALPQLASTQVCRGPVSILLVEASELIASFESMSKFCCIFFTESTMSLPVGNTPGQHLTPGGDQVSKHKAAAATQAEEEQKIATPPTMTPSPDHTIGKCMMKDAFSIFVNEKLK